MLRYLLSAMAVIWLTATLTFFALRVLPGDAITAQLMQSGASTSEIDELRTRLGLNAPLLNQYTQYIVGVLQGDLGESLLSGQSVTEMILERLQPTLTLALSAIVIASTLGIGLGTLAAFPTVWASGARLIIILAISTPLYWTGTLAIILFAAQWQLLPSSGTGSVQHLIMPVGVLSFHTMGEIARVTQSNLQDLRTAPYVQVARGKGLRERTVIWRYMLRVGLLPIVTVIALQLGFLMSGTVITESLFVRPGIGRLLLNSTIRQDYPVVQGIVLCAAIAYTMLNTFADLLYWLLDPRL